jgi:predicted  nucleic acid-binding Zn-ribbon protein
MSDEPSKMIMYKAGCVNCGRMLTQYGEEPADDSVQNELNNGCAVCGNQMMFIYSGIGEALFDEMREKKLHEDHH